MHRFVEDSIFLNDIWESNYQYPDVAVSVDGKTYVVSEKSGRHSDEIILDTVEDKRVASSVKISGKGLAFRPCIESIGSDVYVAWSEYFDGLWHIVLRSIIGNIMQDAIIIDYGEALFYPSFVKESQVPILLYNRQGVGYSETVEYKYGQKRVVSTARKTYRPTGVAIEDGYIISYDSFNGASYDIMARVVCDDKLGNECKVNSRTLRCAQPVLAKTRNAIVIGWYENGASSYFSYNTAELSVDGDAIKAKKEIVQVENRNWYNNVAIASNDTYVVFAYTIGKNNVVCRVRKEDSTWSNGCLLGFDDGRCGVRPNLALDSNDILHYVWQYAMKNGHNIRNAQTVYNEAPVATLLQYDDKAVENALDRFVQPIEGYKDLSSVSMEAKERWMKKNDIKDFVLFGDIHGQSNMSDGMGEIDQYFHYAKVDSKMDFCALTDHDCYPDESTDAEWEFNRATRNIFNGDDGLVVLLAYEWTPNEYMHDFGHRNVYYPGREGKLFTSVDPSGLNPDRLYSSIKKAGGICIPHHPAADWTIVSAACDWNYHDEEVEPMVEIFSRHADYEATEKRSKYTKNINKFPHRCAQDALKRGYHLGFTAGSDSHQMEHGKEGGIFAAFMEDKSSKALFDALKKRATFATTGARMLLYVTINGARMGSIISGDKRALKASGVAVSKIDKVEVIKNGNVVYSTTPDGLEFDISFQDSKELEEDYYYVRIRQEDEQYCWSSPIWVK